MGHVQAQRAGTERLPLAKKTALITGASGFLGRALTQGLLEAGARVVMMSRSQAVEQDRRAYAEQFTTEQIEAHQVDFYDHEALDRALHDVARQGPVDVLVNNAYDMGPRTGFNTPAGHLETSDFDQWASAFDAGLYWAVRATQVIGAAMKARRQGSIVNVASMYGLVSPNPALYEQTAYLNPVTYSAVKAGLMAFTRYVAAFWGAYGIRCNALAPGPFPNTERPSDNAVGSEDPFVRRLEERTLLKRVGRPEELIGPLVFLASDASSYVTGHTLVVDGGWVVT